MFYKSHELNKIKDNNCPYKHNKKGKDKEKPTSKN